MIINIFMWVLFVCVEHWFYIESRLTKKNTRIEFIAFVGHFFLEWNFSHKNFRIDK